MSSVLNLRNFIKHILLCSSLVVIIIITKPIGALGQAPPGSPYTYFGIGDINNKGYSSQLLKGGTGIADRSGYSINNLNPASYSAIGYPYTFLNEFSLSVALATRNDDDNEGFQIDMEFPYLVMAFKTGQNSGASVGLRKYSNVDYRVFGVDQFDGISGKYKVMYEGTGGLNEFYLGYGRHINSRLSLGLHLSYIFGSLKNTQKINGVNINYNVGIEDNNFLRAFNFDLGAQYTIPMHKSSLSIGLTYDMQNDVQSTRELFISTSQPGFAIPTDTVSYNEDYESDDNYILPHSIGLGITWNNHDKFKLNGDVQLQLWSASSLSGDNYALRNSARVGVGFEKLSNYKRKSFWSQLNYGVGVFAERSYLVLENEGLNNTGVTLGGTIPIGMRGMLKIIAERGARGSQLSDFFSESYTKITFSVTFMDLWFQQSRYK